MKWLLSSAAILIATSIGVYWYASTSDERADVVPPLTGDENTSPLNEPVVETASPFAISEAEDSVDSSDSILDSSNVQPSVSFSQDAPQTQEMLSWHTPLSDEQYRKLVSQLKSNPALLQQLVDDFRQEMDPDTKKSLARLLGKVGGEQATLLASELIFSGDSGSRALGMNLLQQIQPGNSEARNIVSGMLATEVEPGVLVDALSALSNPGNVEPQSRAYLADQVALLTLHQDGGVRVVSLKILSRWSDDGRYTDVLLAGLDDSSEYVRSSAAYALADHEDKSPVVIERLLMTLRDVNEVARVKHGAITALRYMPVTSDQAAEIEVLERRVNTVQR